VTAKLRPLQPHDAERMLEWLQDEQVTRYMRIGGKDTTLLSVKRFIEKAQIENVDLHRAVVDDADVYYGTVSLKNISDGRAEYAICLHKDAAGIGIAQQATKQILEIAFNERALHTVYLNVLADNEKAVSFYTKYGFAYTHCDMQHFKGEQKKFLWYELRKD
jgi:diamine N-acetyltransferase